MSNQTIISAIDTAPLNRGLSGAAWLATPGNIAIEIGDNVALFDAEGDGIYQIHVLFVSRGRLAIIAAKEAIRRMFADHGAALIFGMVPRFRRDVNFLARWVGMRPAGIRNTSEGPCELFVLPKEIWSLQ